VAQINVAVGADSTLDTARSAILDYYRFARDYAERTAEGMLAHPGRRPRRDRLLHRPGRRRGDSLLRSPDPGQVARLADAAG
jgi:hypothetical protein